MAAQPYDSKSEPVAAHLCVLLVEEEANVRLGVAEWLRELGYRVVEAQAPQLWSCSGAPPT